MKGIRLSLALRRYKTTMMPRLMTQRFYESNQSIRGRVRIGKN